MATQEEKEGNARLRQEAADAKFARDSNQTPNGKDASEEAKTVAKSMGGLSGTAAKEVMGRKNKIDQALKDAGAD